MHLLMPGGRPVLRRIQRVPAGWILASGTHGTVPAGVPDGGLAVPGRAIAAVQPMP